jgi:UDP-GlcNAc:undecaprenyl-phosphate GlcNAc-1-phosphate transferase
MTDSISLAAYPALALIAAVLALVATPRVRALALRLGAVDRPTPGRVHDHPVPRLGGLAILLAALGTPLIARLGGLDVASVLAARGWGLDWLFAGLVVIVATGIADDVRGLDPLPKLALQIVAATLALRGGYGLAGVTNPLTGGYVTFGLLTGAVLTIAWIVLVTNALNLIDGLDGLASGVALIASTTLLVIALTEDRADAAIVWAILIGALAGFLRYNFNPASIFLGDTGSLLLGYLLSVLSLQSLQKGATAVVILVPILALGVPIMDTVVTLVRRALVSGVASIFRGDREHVHDRLLQSGFSHRNAVLVLYGACAVFGALAFLAVAVQGIGNALVVGLAAGGTYAVIRSLRYDVTARAGRGPDARSDRE